MNYELESKICLERIFQSIDLTGQTKKHQQIINQRLEQSFPQLFELLSKVYQQQYDLHYHLDNLVKTLVDNYLQRSAALKKKDQQRLNDPQWFRSEKMVGMACYVDLVADDLNDLISKIPYYQNLGISYLHLMPLYKSPEGENDGGYAVSDYRQVNPELGTVEQLKKLATAMDKAGISLVLDFVFNHTSDEHEWALKARKGEQQYQQYYHLFDDRTMPDQYENTIREIFPQVRRGSFTYLEDIDKWVWTTFNSFQWDLNYANPEVFRAIVDEMLFLANLGCDVLRLDALAFIWKQLGTSCESQPNAHLLIQAFNTCLKIAAPGVLFKSEAIVHPDEVVQYIDKDECQLSYNPLLMALIWNSLATRKTRLINQSLTHRFNINQDCSWVNYARCHDDIGWTFDDGDAGNLGINGYDHRRFLNQFYTGRFEGSFSRGVAFQENPETGDCRVCGSLASLAGLELALSDNNPVEIEHAVNRITMIHGILLSIGGIPLLYQGDELATLNDYSYLKNEAKLNDSRWVNRPKISEALIQESQTTGTVQQRIFQQLKNLIAIRKDNELFGMASTQITPTANQHIFAFTRENNTGENMLVICNFSEFTQVIDPKLVIQQLGGAKVKDLVTTESFAVAPDSNSIIQPYQLLWLIKES